MKTRLFGILGSRLGPVAVMLFLAAGVGDVSGDVHTWKGGTGSWDDETQWTNGVPLAGGDVVIAKGTVTLPVASAELATFEMKGGSLVFTGAEACVTALEVAITNGTVSHVVNSATTTNLDGTWDVDGRVYFSCSNFLLKAPGIINVNALGYKSVGTWTKGYGPGAGGAGILSGNKGAGGAGHGSAGIPASGGGVGGGMYDSAVNPVYPGSGGGSAAKLGGFGGGVVRIEATNGTVTVSGTITANGGNAVLNTGRGGGGSGGGIYIGCRVLAGTNGLISANAGERADNGGPGGSGRIAVSFDPIAQAAAPKPRVVITVKRSASAATTSLIYSDIGTVSITDSSLFDENWMPHTGALVCPAFTNWTVNVLVITNGWIRFPNTVAVFPLTVSNAMTIAGSEGILQIFKPELNCGSLTLTNSAGLYLYSMPTSGIAGDRDYGAIVSVSNTMQLGPGCWVYPGSVGTNGGSPYFRMVDLEVATNGGFNADAIGFQRGTYSGGVYYNAYGPGKGPANIYGGAGGGYGGRGGTVNNGGRGAAYGDALEPLLPGSGGGGQTDGGSAGGNGGGLIRIEASGSVNLNGTLTANGQKGGSYGGGGSGGGIFVKCTRFSGGGAGRLWANGGDLGQSSDGGGGGGRIAIWYGPWNTGTLTPARLVDNDTNAPASFSGAFSLLPGDGYYADAEPGTMRYVQVRKESYSGCVILVR